jgi:hypothetical protein
LQDCRESIAFLKTASKSQVEEQSGLDRVIVMNKLFQHSRTIDTTGREVIWDSTSDDADAKRFCSLNLTVVMEALPDLSIVPPPHLIFKGTNFCASEDL